MASSSSILITTHVFPTWFIEYFQPSVETHYFFQLLLLIDNAPGYPRALMEMYKIYVVFLLDNKTPVL